MGYAGQTQQGSALRKVAPALVATAAMLLYAVLYQAIDRDRLMDMLSL